MWILSYSDKQNTDIQDQMDSCSPNFLRFHPPMCIRVDDWSCNSSFLGLNPYLQCKPSSLYKLSFYPDHFWCTSGSSHECSSCSPAGDYCFTWSSPVWARSLFSCLSLGTVTKAVEPPWRQPWLTRMARGRTHLSLHQRHPQMVLFVLRVLCWCCLCYCSVTKLCLTLCSLMNCSTPGFPLLHYLPEFAQTHGHWVIDAIQPSHPLSSLSPPSLSLSQHQVLFQWVSSLQQVVKVLELQLQHQSF